jgi:RNA recognition motif. (a.k.a. RRM, RBD, or RNP domain)
LRKRIEGNLELGLYQVMTSFCNDQSYENESTLGLGYKSSHHHQLAEDLMQQCLAYHLERQAQSNPNLESETCSQNITELSQNNSQSEEEHIDAFSELVRNKALIEIEARKAVARAQAIIQKFQQGNKNGILSSNQSTTGNDWKRRRDDQLRIERSKMDEALLKNWEYLAKREDERFQNQMKHIHETQQFEEDVIRLRTLQQQQRKSQLPKIPPNRNSGIGTSDQRDRKRKIQKLQKRTAEKGMDFKSSLYLSNMSHMTNQEVIHALFGSYGKIKRVHLYCDKETGERKGDGLVVYEHIEAHSMKDFLLSVCAQVSRKKKVMLI